MGKTRKQKKETDNEDKKIKSIESFISSIKEIKATGNIFYRGHSNETYELEPSIYRRNEKGEFLYIENEDKIYRETISKVPYDFNGKNTIESLVLMQHYGVPTRILDLTTNPLVALYFACIGNKDKDGEVIVFDIPEESTCYFDSDRITVLANLAKCKNYFYYKDGDIPSYKKYIKELENKAKTIPYNIEIGEYIEIKKNIKERVKDYIKKNKYFFIHSKDIDDQINEIIGKKNSDICSENYTQRSSLLIEELERETKNLLWEERLSINDEYLGELLHFIKEDKSYFQNIINPDDIGSIFAVKPKLDNPRIVRQQGAFLIFGIEKLEISIDPKTKPIKKMIKVPNKWIIRGEIKEDEQFINALTNNFSPKIDNDRIIIKSSEKEVVLKELDKLGINESTLFPEIDKVADYIKEKYTAKN